MSDVQGQSQGGNVVVCVALLNNTRGAQQP